MMALYDEMSMDDNTLGMYDGSGTHGLFQSLLTQYGVVESVRLDSKTVYATKLLLNCMYMFVEIRYSKCVLTDEHKKEQTRMRSSTSNGSD